jgi:hypothetical protein
MPPETMKLLQENRVTLQDIGLGKVFWLGTKKHRQQK